jgi:hypothetical protein
MKNLFLASAFLAATALMSPATAAELDVHLLVPLAPPAPKVVVRPKHRHPGMIWIGGHWVWKQGRWVWKKGHWARPPHAHAVWIPGQWVKRPRGYLWIAGHWKV